MTTLVIHKSPMAKPKGRPRKDAVRRTFRIDSVNLGMLITYADRNSLDVTAALNLLLRTNLSAIGLLPEGEAWAKAQAEEKEKKKD